MITIINTGVGNFKSIQNMLARLGVKSLLSEHPDDVLKADKLILPGIGSFDQGMEALNKHNLVEAIKFKVLEEKTKILGICLGMQMFGSYSDEGNTPGLSLIKGTVKKFKFLDGQTQKKVPHMGWNYVIARENIVLFKGFESSPRFYFTHSFYFDCQDNDHSIGKTPYGINFTSVIHKDNIYGVQFHPEKSHRFGLQLLKNFIV